MSAPWERLARLYMPPAAAEVVDVLSRPAPEGSPGWSSSMIAAQTGRSVERTAYHVRALRGHGVIVKVGQRRVRALVESFYALEES